MLLLTRQFWLSWADLCVVSWHTEKHFILVYLYEDAINFFICTHPFCNLVRKRGIVLTLPCFLHWNTTCWDYTVPEQLIFKKIQLKRHILVCILSYQDPNIMYVSGRTYTIHLLSLCRATSCLHFFFLNSLALWYQQLMTI